jgi:hypothetical protein
MRKGASGLQVRGKQIHIFLKKDDDPWRLQQSFLASDYKDRKKRFHQRRRIPCWRLEHMKGTAKDERKQDGISQSGSYVDRIDPHFKERRVTIAENACAGHTSLKLRLHLIETSHMWEPA